MPTKDLASGVLAAAYTSAAALNTVKYLSCTFIVPVQNTTSLAFTECDTSGGTYTDVAERNLIVSDSLGTKSGNDVAYAASGTGTIGYVGKKQYVKMTVTNAVSNTTIHSILGNPLVAPV